MILTPDQRLRVFVSSTLGELARERAVVRQAVTSLRLAPVMFELGARPHPPQALYRSYLEQSHVFLALYGNRYGWVAPGMTVSGLEDEYRLSGARPKLVYVLDPAPDREERLARLLDDVAADPQVRLRTWSRPDDLLPLVAGDLAALLAEAFGGTPGPDRDGRAGDGGLVVGARPGVGVSPGGAATPGGAAGALPLPGRVPPLPVATTSLVGRQTEIAALADLVRRPDVRMVTITGMGGIGKSRVALEVAHRVAPDFPGGVVLVPLAELAESAAIVTRIAGSLAVRLATTRPPVDVVADAVAAWGPLLLVLDNAEHIRGVADDLSALVSACRNLTLLVTSRSRLRLAAEYDVPLPPLAVSGSQAGPRPPSTGGGASPGTPAPGDAVRLFLERAAEARPDLDLAADATQLRAIHELCRRVDGLPLAIEIAAARVRLLLPSDLLSRLEDRLDLPAARLADLPPRQQTLRATLDWSHDLLSPDERSVFAQMSTFAGGASLEAIEQVVSTQADLLDALGALADQSLLDVDTTAVDPPRFTMLGIVRDYARLRLDASGVARATDAAHCAWVRSLAERARRELPGPGHAPWMERLDLEAANLLAAARRAVGPALGPDPEALAQIAYCTWLWLWARHHAPSARRWMERGLEHPDRLTPQGHARLLWCIAAAAAEQGEHETAERRLAEATERFAAIGDPEGTALCGFLDATLAPASGDRERALATFLRVERELRALGDDFVASICARAAGMTAAQLGCDDDAETHLGRALAYADAIDNALLLGAAHVARAYTRLGRGALGEAAGDFAAGASWGQRSGNPESLSLACDGMAGVLLARGETGELPARLVGAGQGLRERVGAVPWPGLLPVVEAIAGQARAVGERTRTEAAYRSGWQLEPAAALELVTSAARAVSRHSPG